MSKKPFQEKFFPSNQVKLLKGSAAFFEALIKAVDSAQESVWIETYILSNDDSVLAVLKACEKAAKRGVQVYLTIDGFGSGGYGRSLMRVLPNQGIQMRIFRPERWWRMSRRLLRRMHRKLALIDDRTAFVGGINLLDDYIDPTHGPLVFPRLDYCVQLQGPIIKVIALSMRRQWAAMVSLQQNVKQLLGEKTFSAPIFPEVFSSTLINKAGGTSVAFLPRDNLRYRTTIERSYRAAINQAKKEIVLANAYFLPGRRLRMALINAALRGVRVRLLLQGRMEYWLQHHATQALYGQLLDAGIKIYEYRKSFLHAKVAVVDDDWATVGSSNIDPFSLLLAREANVVIKDAAFAAQLKADLELEISQGAEQVHPNAYANRSFLTRVFNWLAYGCVRLGLALTGVRGNY